MFNDNTAQHRACVVTPGRVFYGDGSTVETRMDLPHDLPGILAATLHPTAGGPLFAEHSTIVVDGTTLAVHEARGPLARHDGWVHSTTAAWTLYRRDGRTVSVGIRDAMIPAQHYGVVFDKTTSPRSVATRLGAYNHLVQTAWRGTPATTALAGLRLSWANSREEPRWSVPRLPIGQTIGPITWSRDLTPDETAMGYVHTFDVNSAYLAAAINAEVAWGEPVHTRTRVFDPKVPGYWLVQVGLPVRALLIGAQDSPVLIRPKAWLKGGQVWVTTEVGKLMMELGDRVEVLDSYTAVVTNRGAWVPRRSGRVFREWGESLRDARLVAQKLGAFGLEQAIKWTYTDATGAMQRESMRVYRPDWTDTFIDLAAVNLYRRALRMQRAGWGWPVEIHTDSLSYPSSYPAAESLTADLGVRAGLGGFKHAATATTAAWVAARTKRARR